MADGPNSVNKITVSTNLDKGKGGLAMQVHRVPVFVVLLALHSFNLSEAFLPSLSSPLLRERFGAKTKQSADFHRDGKGRVKTTDRRLLAFGRQSSPSRCRMRLSDIR
eukprot:160536-Rhodomonas_salina.1